MNRLQIFNIINSQLSLTDFYNIIECQDLLFYYFYYSRPQLKSVIFHASDNSNWVWNIFLRHNLFARFFRFFHSVFFTLLGALQVKNVNNLSRTNQISQELQLIFSRVVEKPIVKENENLLCDLIWSDFHAIHSNHKERMLFTITLIVWSNDDDRIIKLVINRNHSLYLHRSL